MSKRIVNVAAAFIIIQLLSLLFYSPLSWQIQEPLFNYTKHTELINNVIHFNNYVNNAKNEGKSMLAFGNSQVRSVFLSHKNKVEEEFAWTYIAAFRLAALPHYTPYLKKLKPDNIVLYLSDKDLNQTTVFHSLMHHPAKLSRLLKDGSKIMKHTDHNRTDLATIYGSEFFFPLKFSYQLKHLVKDHFFDKSLIKSLSGRKVKSDFQEKHDDPKNEAIIKRKKNGIKSLIHLRDKEYRPDLMTYNIKLLREFIESMNKDGIGIIIIEAQYHPDAYNHEKYKDQDPHETINRIAADYDHVTVLDINDQLLLEDEEYIDHIHFTKEGGKRLMAKIMEGLETIDQ